MSAEATWEPGDPLMPDNGCGAMITPAMRDDERAAVIAEGGPMPPWWRPEPSGPALGYTRSCKPCDVRWYGDEPCWICGQETA